MKHFLTREYIYALVLFIGLVLMAGGIITGKSGALVVGIIIAGVNAQQWIQWKRK